MSGLIIAWLVIFFLTLVTHIVFMAKGVLPLITALCIFWFAYWTLSILRNMQNRDSKKIDS